MTTDKEAREAFERCIGRLGIGRLAFADFSRDGLTSDYLDFDTQLSWEDWQAARSTQPSGDTMRYCPNCGTLGEIRPTTLTCCPEHAEAYIPKAIAFQAHEGFMRRTQPSTNTAKLVTQCKSFMRSSRWDQAGEIVDQIAMLTMEANMGRQAEAEANEELEKAVDVVAKLREALLLCRPEHVTRGAIALADEFLGSVK